MTDLKFESRPIVLITVRSFLGIPRILNFNLCISWSKLPLKEKCKGKLACLDRKLKATTYNRKSVRN